MGEHGTYSDTSIERCSASCTYNPIPDDAKYKDLDSVWISPDGTIYSVGDDSLILRRTLDQGPGAPQ